MAANTIQLPVAAPIATSTPIPLIQMPAKLLIVLAQSMWGWKNMAEDYAGRVEVIETPSKAGWMTRDDGE
ncbi:hypothetical protein [Gryllotalpicola sp.]|uniref:hypothetical protein n=1 Tax=Gryllotalpicola sp. TaxID=1932787 RepID=UPI0026321CB5|nr:hypothetical protein [Gryllotalpicola sp.]